LRDQRSKQPRRTNDYHVQSHCGEHHQHAGHRSCDSPMRNHNISRHNGLVTERERKETGKGLGKGWFVGERTREGLVCWGLALVCWGKDSKSPQIYTDIYTYRHFLHIYVCVYLCKFLP